jgi:light-harvesting complex 1 beta chain
MSDNTGPSGLTAKEAQEFHSLFMAGFIGFTVIAVVAHFLVWMWRPWFPPVEGWSVIDSANSLLSNIAPLVA